MLDFGFYNMDCMQGMREFPDKYFDLAIVDPPYGRNGGNVERTGGTWSAKYEDVQRIKTWDFAPDESYFAELFRVSKNQIIWGGNYFTLPPTRGFVIWRKANIPEKFTLSMCEYGWTSFDRNAKVYECYSSRQAGRFHPTQKPIELYLWLLNNYAQPGDIILDTHVGSASSLIACYETNHKYVGFEIDEEYYKKAAERLKNETAQLHFDFVGATE